MYKSGVKLESFSVLPDYFLTLPGEYTFMVTTASGKIDVKAVTVSQIPQGFDISSIQMGGNYRVQVEGEGINRIFVYHIIDGASDRINVAGTQFNVYETGYYAIIAEYGSGLTEMAVVRLGKPERIARSCMASAGGTSPIGFAAVSVLLSALWFALTRGRKAASIKS